MKIRGLHKLADYLDVRQKGLLLVGVPLIFQLVFVFCVAILYDQAEKEAWKQSQLRLLSNRINTTIKDLWGAGELMFAYSITKDKVILARWQEKKQSIVESLDSLRKQAIIDSSDYRRSVDSMIVLSNRGVNLMEGALNQVEGSKGLQTVDVYMTVKPFIDKLGEELESTIEADLKARSNSLLKEGNSRSTIASVLYAGVAVDVAITIALSAFFASSIARRLSILSDNTKRVREKKPLHENVSGNDEIAFLDSQFHELAQALEESERLRHEFLSMTSHDLKTPLMSVELSLDLLNTEMESKMSERAREELQSAKANMKRVLTLVNDLLDLERGSAGKLRLEWETLRARSIVQRACDSVRPLAERKNVTLTINVGQIDLVGDRRRLEQVLVNLIANAVKFSPEHSDVVISANEIEDFVELRVRDHGIGIAEGLQESIFERFEQSTPGSLANDFGSGLGLAICKTIVQAHSGRIGVSSAQPTGSVFWVQIARSKE